MKEKFRVCTYFGASKHQLALHTGVVYYHLSDVSEEDGYSKQPCISFYSVSDNLQHNACAVWAHLQPILQMIAQKFPNVNTLHFQSDRTTSQYRNRTNFFLFQYFCNLLSLESANYNFTEAGHGKGSADGIRSVIKRTAD